MFRALFWKEWRELWVLPVVAAPLAVMGFFLAQPERLILRSETWTKALTSTSLLRPDVWICAFSCWLILAAVYIPSHLFARERESDTIDFLLSRPLDHFRLWWLKVIVGISVLLVIAVVLYCVAWALSLSHNKTAGYADQQAIIVQGALGLACLILSLSLLFSVFSNRQVFVIGSVAVLFLFLLPLAIAAGYLIYPVKSHLSRLSKGELTAFDYALILCPSVLLASLVGFAGRNLWKRTRGTLAVAYLLSVISAAVPTAMGVSQLPFSKEIAKQRPEKTSVFSICDISDDGTNILLRTYPDGTLVLADLTHVRASIIDKGDVPFGRIDNSSHTIIYHKVRTYWFSKNTYLKAFCSNFQGTHRRQLPSDSPLLGSRSADGKYIGLVQSADESKRKQSFVAIFDSKGHLLGKHEFPILEEAALLAIGWDYRERFYFMKVSGKREARPTYWRIQPDRVVPEEIELLSDTPFSFKDVYLLSISPDGRWLILSGQFVHKDPHKREIRLYNIENRLERSFRAQPYAIRWSHDGKRLAYFEDASSSIVNGRKRGIQRKLMIYEPETERTLSNIERIGIDSPLAWSPSDSYVLFIDQELRHVMKSKVLPDEKRAKVQVLSLRDGILRLISVPEEWNNSVWSARVSLYWIADDRLLWAIENKLIATEADGSNPKEVLRVEDNRFYIGGVQAL